MSEYDFDLSEMSFEGAPPNEKDIQEALGTPPVDVFDKSYKNIQDAMKNVKQEILLTLEDGSSHLVYIMDFKYDYQTNELNIDWNTPSETRKQELLVHVENCIKLQIQEELNKVKSYKARWWIK